VDDYDPITSVGSTDWANYDASVRLQVVGTPPAYALLDPSTVAAMPDGFSGVRPRLGGRGSDDDPIAKGAYAGLCVRQIDQYNSGYCLLVGAGLAGGVNGTGWLLQAGSCSLQRVAGTSIASGKLDAFNLSAWHTLSVGVRGQTLHATIDGLDVLDGLTSPMGSAVPPVGLTSLRSGFHYARFDELQITGAPRPKRAGAPFLVKHLLYAPKLPPGGPISAAKPRNDYNGEVGCAFTLAAPISVTALARFSAGGNGTHTLSLYDATTSRSKPTRLATATVDLATAAFDDLNGCTSSSALDPRPTTQPPLCRRAVPHLRSSPLVGSHAAVLCAARVARVLCCGWQSSGPRCLPRCVSARPHTTVTTSCRPSSARATSSTIATRRSRRRAGSPSDGRCLSIATRRPGATMRGLRRLLRRGRRALGRST
jgi:hypothetical protein